MCEKGKSSKPTRSVRLLEWDVTNYVGSFSITVGSVRTFYGLEFLYSDFGLAFRLRKEDGDVYDLILNLPGGIDACDCPGGTYHGHCKHVDAVRALIAACKLSYPVGRPMVADGPACE